MAKRALAQCTDIITESSIDPFTLARRLYSKEVISESIYKRVIDKETRDSNEDRLERILGHLRDHVSHNVKILTSILNILNDLEYQYLAVLIVKKYKGMLYRMLCCITSELNLELQDAAEKEHITGDNTIQDVLVEKVSKNNRSL